MEAFTPTARTTLRRKPERGTYDRAAINAILDEAFVCHVCFVEGDQPVCIPMVCGRVGDAIYLHGSTGNRMLCALREGAEACVTVTLVDGLVLARSAFRTSVHYRCVMIFGRATEVTKPGEKLEAMRSIVEAVVPGRWEDVREPNERELRAVMVLRLPLAEVSAKVRTGPPADEEEDYAREVWAGVVPLRLAADPPQDDPRLLPGLRPPRYATHYERPSRPAGAKQLHRQ